MANARPFRTEYFYGSKDQFSAVEKCGRAATIQGALKAAVVWVYDLGYDYVEIRDSAGVLHYTVTYNKKRSEMVIKKEI